ncbi:MAG: murein biosynthesis integral membrane protein MurJ, partial [Acidobacteriota bacterium]
MDSFENTNERASQNKRLVRSTLVVAAPTLLSRIFGFIRDVIQAFFLGTSRSGDAFTIAYVIPNLLRRLTGEGAMTAAFIPVFTQIKKEKTKKELWRFANMFFFDLMLVMTGLTVLGIIFSPFLVKIIGYGFKDIQGKWELTVILTRIMFPYIFLISLAALVMAILNSFHKFFVPAFTPVLFNLAVISLAAIFAGKVEEPAYVFAAGVVLGGILQLGFQLPFLRKMGMRFTPLLSFSHPGVRKVGKLMIPGIFGVGISQINFALSRMLASTLEEGSVSSLYFASRVEELTLGLFSIALSIVLLPSLSELAARKEIDDMKKTLLFSFKLVTFVTFPAVMGLVILNRPIIEVLFQRGLFDFHSTAMSSSCLFYFAFGLPFLSGVKILAPAFYSLKDTRTPVVVAFFVMISYISSSFLLMGPLRVGGIALALSLASVLNFFLLFYLLERKIGKIPRKEIFSFVFKSAGAAVVMGVLVWLIGRNWEKTGEIFLQKLFLLAGAIFLGMASYMILQYIV